MNFLYFRYQKVWLIRKLGILILLFALTNCITPYQSYIPASNEIAYLKKAIRSPLTFLVPEGKEDEYWARANSFIAQYSGMRIQIANEYTIETYGPISIAYGYSAIKIFDSDGLKIKVNCSSEIDFPEEDRNAHIFSYYIQTGQIIEKFLGMSTDFSPQRENNFSKYY